MLIVKEKILKISTPTPKTPIKQLPVDDWEQQTNVSEEIKTEELQQPQPVDFNSPVGFTNTSGSGWKVSDILREIRLDNL